MKNKSSEFDFKSKRGAAGSSVVLWNLEHEDISSNEIKFLSTKWKSTLVFLKKWILSCILKNQRCCIAMFANLIRF